MEITWQRDSRESVDEALRDWGAEAEEAAAASPGVGGLRCCLAASHV
jgi:hypothetical protein